MCTPRALFSRLFLKICFFVFSLYTEGWSLWPCLMKSILNLHHYRLETEGKVWSAYIHTVNRMTRRWDMAVWNFPRWPPAAILNLIQPEMAPLDLSSPKTPPWNQTRRRSADALQSYGHLKFSQNVWIGPEVGRSSVVNIHTSYATLGT